MKLFKPTPFLIVFGILGVILVITAIHYIFFENNGGMALAGVIAGIAAIINLIVIGIDRIAINIKYINIKALWVVETIIIVCLAVYVYLNGIPTL